MRHPDPVACLATAAAVVAVLCAACASQGMPPGGPPDVAPPLLLHVLPESGSISVSPRAVAFTFNEVISEQPRGAPSLDGIVVVSPSDGRPDVSWERTRLVVRPHRAWRANTAYSVTILPGLSDLRNNAATQPFRTIFATGTTIPTGVATGVAFDWMEGRAAPKARIEGTTAGDTLLAYGAAADSLGRYALSTLPSGRFLVRAWLDQNTNGRVDPREPWDSATLAVADTVRHDFYLFPHDTLGARIARISVVDSVTLRLTFDHGLRPDSPLTADAVHLTVGADSALIPVRRVLAATTYDSAAALARVVREDSIARADTSEAGRRALARRDSLRRTQMRDSAAQAQIDSLRQSRDSVRREVRPRLGRPIPPTVIIVETATPLPVQTVVRVTVTGAQALAGPPRSSDRLVRWERPPPRDSTGTRRPPAGARPPHDGAVPR